MIVEKATGSTVSELLSKRFFEPLGLDRIGLQGDVALPGPFAVAHEFRATDTAVAARRRYDEEYDRVPTTAWATGTWTAGGMAGTATDVARWIDALFAGRFLEPASLEEMRKPAGTSALPGYPADAGYGLGLELAKYRGFRVVGHTGELPGYRSIAGYFPERDLSVGVMVNVDSDAHAQTIVMAVADAALAGSDR